MPKKGHRTASRQAQLRQRRRHGRGRAHDVDREHAQARPPLATVRSPAGEQPRPAPAVAGATASPQSARRFRRQSAAEPRSALAYTYLGKELKQIGMITSLMVAILAVLTVVLRA